MQMQNVFKNEHEKLLSISNTVIDKMRFAQQVINSALTDESLETICFTANISMRIAH